MNDFNGRNISGEISHSTSGPVDQADPQVLLDALDALLDTPGVEAVRWEQYTPYFNDGEACVFNVYSPTVKLTNAKALDDYDEETEFFTEYDLFSYEDVRSRTNFNKVYSEIDGIDTEIVYKALEVFGAVLESGKHDVILNKKFGDPAQVTATKNEFSVEYYEHD